MNAFYESINTPFLKYKLENNHIKICEKYIILTNFEYCTLIYNEAYFDLVLRLLPSQIKYVSALFPKYKELALEIQNEISKSKSLLHNTVLMCFNK